MTQPVSGRARFTDAPMPLNPLPPAPPPDGLEGVLVLSLPAGSYRFTEDQDGLRVWRNPDSTATGDQGRPLTPTEQNARNKEFWKVPTARPGR